MVEPLETVALLNMQVRPSGSTRIGESPTVQGTARLLQVPSSQRNCVPAWQLAAPVENEIPPYWQVRDATTRSPLQLLRVASHSPSSHLYSRPP
jgi:hypothetical protein